MAEMIVGALIMLFGILVGAALGRMNIPTRED